MFKFNLIAKFICTLFLLSVLPTNTIAKQWATNYNHPTLVYDYEIIAQDKTRHVFSVGYYGIVQSYQYQTGRSAHGLTFKDTRDCHYGSRFEIKRQRANTSHSTNDILKDGNFISKIRFSTETNVLGLGGVVEDFARIAIYPKHLEDYVKSFKGKSTTAKILKIPVAYLHAAKLLGTGLARAVKLRTGVNCGESQNGINATNEGAKSILKSLMGSIPKYDKYITIFDILRNWQYKSKTDGKWYGPISVMPLNVDENYKPYQELHLNEIYRAYFNREPGKNVLNSFLRRYQDRKWQVDAHRIFLGISHREATKLKAHQDRLQRSGSVIVEYTCEFMSENKPRKIISISVYTANQIRANSCIDDTIAERFCVSKIHKEAELIDVKCKYPMKR